MDNTEIKINLYRINNKILKLIFYIIISIYLFIQFILLSNFLFKYFKSKNYGYLLEKICQTKNTEFESERFQLYNNIDEFKIEHNKKINYTLILSLILIYGIIYGMILSYIIYDFYYNIIITENNDIKKMFYYVLLSLSSIISIGYLPYYIGIKFDNIKNKILLEADDYLLNIFTILSVILLIVNYYKKFKSNYNNILLITLIITFYLIIYYIKKFINMYKNNIGNDNIIKNELNENDLLKNYIIEIFGLKYYYEKIEKNDDNNINYYIFLAQIFIIILIILFLINNIKNIFNFFKNYNLEQLLNCLFYRNNSICEYILYNAADSRLLYNIFSRPIIIIILLVIIIYSISVYNKYFNNFIITQPKIIYNGNIKLIDKEFNKLLHNDKIDYNTTTSIEKNVANAIQLVLYNEIFGKVLQYDKDSEYIEDYNEYIKHINFVPDFKYDFDKKDRIIKYSELEEYNIKKYLNNIFYENKTSKEKCDEMNINKYFLKKFIENIYFNDQINDGEKCSREELRKKKLKYKIYKSIKNIKNGYNYIGNSKFDNTKIEINNKIDINIDYSVISDITISEINDLLGKFDFGYNIKKILEIYYDEYINILKTNLFKIINQTGVNTEHPETGPDCKTIYEYKITKSIINDFIYNPANNNRINDIKNFIESKLCSTFNSINTKLEKFNYKENKKDKLETYIIKNYNVLNNENLNSIKKSDNISPGSTSALLESNDLFNDYTKKCFTDILVNILINHKIIRFVYSYYSLSDIDSILNKIKDTYDETINEKYIKYLKYLYTNLSNTYYNYKYNDENKLNKKDITNILIEIDYNNIKENINTIINKYNNDVDLINIYFEKNKIYRDNDFSDPGTANENTSITQTLFDSFEENQNYFTQHLDNKIKYISGITNIDEGVSEPIASEQTIIKDKLVNYYEMFRTLQYDILESLHYSNFNEINLSRILDNYKYFDKFEAVFEEFINDKDFVKLESETTSTIDIPTPQNSNDQKIKKLNADINTINILTIYIIVMYIIIIFSIKYI
jgi:hypothetical protein|uniref:Uncharacterized protein n=1 Tax=viral metagenome TaxID=1070528 RepID=A0A6C0JN70_9ZZZZ